MKKSIMLMAFTIIYTFATAQQADQILGTWFTQDKNSKVAITKNDNGQYEGKIVWLRRPKKQNGDEKVDHNNPDKNLQARPIIGLKLLQGFTFDAGNEEWVDGTIYDPESGNTYKCLMWFDGNNNELNVKGYIGVSIMGRKVKWERDS